VCREREGEGAIASHSSLQCLSVGSSRETYPAAQHTIAVLVGLLEDLTVGYSDGDKKKRGNEMTGISVGPPHPSLFIIRHTARARFSSFSFISGLKVVAMIAF
jgi:hypothetical protein